MLPDIHHKHEMCRKYQRANNYNNYVCDTIVHTKLEILNLLLCYPVCYVTFSSVIALLRCVTDNDTSLLVVSCDVYRLFSAVCVFASVCFVTCR